MNPRSPPDPCTDYELPRAHGGALGCATLRAHPTDFVVDEVLGFVPEGSGGHAWLEVRKTGRNTPEVATALARHAGVPGRDVGFSGLKDRHAVTTQWFSVGLEGRPEPDWTALQAEGVEVLAVTRHPRKLRRGTHRGNRFRIRLRAVDVPLEVLRQRLAVIAGRGVPNYFGPQRFGRDGGNVAAARRMLAGEVRVRDRQRRGMYLSAARSLLFNRALARRVADGTWDRPLPGDVMALEGSRSLFRATPDDPDLATRAAAGDIHPTGPLWGEGGMTPEGVAATVERAALAPCAWWREALERARLEMDRRALRLAVRDATLVGEDDGVVVVTFELTTGAYATTVVDELVDTGGCERLLV